MILLFIHKRNNALSHLNMYNSATTNELLLSPDCSGNSRINLLLQRRTKKQEVSVMSFASEEDDEVLFDSKQRFSLHLTV